MIGRLTWMTLLLAVACGDSRAADAWHGDASRDATRPTDGALADGALADGGGADAGADAAVSCLVTDAAAFPRPTSGACEARIETPGATLPPGDDGAGGWIVPGGRRVTRTGHHVSVGGFPLAVLPIPGTRFVAVTDGHVHVEHLSIVDVEASTVVSSVERSRSGGALFYGLALSADGRRLFASGGGTAEVYAFDVAGDGQLTEVPSAAVTIERADRGVGDEYLSGLARVGGTDVLAIAGMFSGQVVLWDTARRREVGRVTFPENALPYGVASSADGAFLYVSGWGRASLYVVSVAAVAIVATIPVGKDPEGVELSPDGTRVAVAGSDGDTITIVDTTSRTVVSTVPIVAEDAPRGSSPVECAWSADGRRLYVASSGDNAIDVFDVRAGGSRVTHAGRIPTMWYPTDVAVLGDGRLVVSHGKYEGTGPNDDPAHVDITDLVRGSVATIDPPTDAEAAAGEIEVAANNRRPMGFASVTCPDGAAYDFPIPRPGEGPSSVIQHVILVVRENKTFDAYYGDLVDAEGRPHGNGDPDLTVVPHDEMDRVLPNTRALGLEFALLDGFYSGGEQSIQGHVWTTFGRTTDFTERTYPTSWGRRYWMIPPQGVLDPAGFPEEGTMFEWLLAQGLSFRNHGEIVGGATRNADIGLDRFYPGLFFNTGVLDIVKARYLARQWQDRCRLPSVSYVVLPDDHTEGGSAGRPTPRSMIADNDEALGLLADALSHSSFWPSTAMFVIEDDPQDGGDHVDNHRSPALVISPWVKRGYVSSVHYHESSLWRTIQLILGIADAPNAMVETAAPMLDMFTGTPDYTPYTYTPRRWPEETNPGGTRFAILSRGMDFSQPDRAEGLSRLLWQMLRSTDPPWASRPEIEDGVSTLPRGAFEGR